MTLISDTSITTSAATIAATAAGCGEGRRRRRMKQRVIRGHRRGRGCRSMIDPGAAADAA